MKKTILIVVVILAVISLGLYLYNRNEKAKQLSDENFVESEDDETIEQGDTITGTTGDQVQQIPK